MHLRTGSTAEPSFGRVKGADPLHPVLARHDFLGVELVSDKAIAKARVVVADIEDLIGQIGVGAITFGDGILELLEIVLFGERQYPAGHRGGKTLDGKVTNQRELHFRRTVLPKYAVARRRM